MLRIYLNTWGNYNENGADGGEWIELPMIEEELEATKDRIAEAMGDDDPEWFINDYEWMGIEFGLIAENDDVDELNELIEQLENLDEWEQKEVAAAIEAFDYDLEDAIERQQNGYFTFFAGMDIDEVAEELVADYITRDVPEFFTRYFDYDAFARDLEIEGYTETEWGVICDY